MTAKRITCISMTSYMKTPLITYSGYYKERKKKYRNQPFHVENWLYLEEQDYIFAQQNALLELKNIVEEKIKVGLYGISKSMSVRIVEGVPSVHNVQK